MRKMSLLKMRFNQMKKTIYLITIIIAFSIFSGCKKGDTGPAGPTGTAGPQGPNGNANVSTKTFFLSYMDWANVYSNGTLWETELIDTAINTNVYHNGSVQIFLSV